MLGVSAANAALGCVRLALSQLVDVNEVDVNEMDVNEDRRKLDQICNSLKRLIRDYLGKILEAAILGRGEKNIKEHCPPPLLLAGLRLESRITNLLG